MGTFLIPCSRKIIFVSKKCLENGTFSSTTEQLKAFSDEKFTKEEQHLFAGAKLIKVGAEIYHCQFSLRRCGICQFNFRRISA